MMSYRIIGSMLLGSVAIMAGKAYAQDSDPPPPPTERVGPQATITTPDFQEPTEFPQIEAPAPPPIPAISGTARISDIEVIAEQGVAGKARSDFGELSDPTYGLRVEAASGATLDAGWVADQFRANALIGGEVPIDRLVAMTQLVNRAFIANGYINSGLLIDGAPPSDGGVLRTRLIFGRLVGEDNGIDLVFTDDRTKGLSRRFVAERMPSASGQPIDVIAVERDFRLLAEDPAIASVSADLQPGVRPGEARLAMVVRPADRFDFYTGFANSRSPAIGGERFSAGGSIRNALAPGDLLSAEGGLTSGEPDANFGYSVPLGGRRTVLNLRGGFNQAAVVDPELRPLDISASDWNIEGGLAHTFFARPLTPRRDGDGWLSARSLTLGLSATHRVSKTKLLGRPFSFSPGAVNGRADYTALRLTGDFVQRGINTVLVVALTGTQGLNGSRGDIPGLISPDKDFRSINGQVSYARLLTPNNLELRLRFAGQYSDGILYSGERFAAGGRQTVRGYRETLVLADTGAIGSIELAQPFSLSGRGGGRGNFDPGSFSVSAFVDGAILGNREIADPVTDKLLSVGGSLSWTPSPAIRASITYAEALKDAVIPGRRDMQDKGFHFAITLRPFELFR